MICPILCHLHFAPRKVHRLHFKIPLNTAGAVVHREDRRRVGDEAEAVGARRVLEEHKIATFQRDFQRNRVLRRQRRCCRRVLRFGGERDVD